MKQKGSGIHGDKVTLRDIARVTGLSINTISKVLNKKPYYSEEAERRVMRAVAELGYVPNALAAGLRAGRSRTIAIVFDDLINPYYSAMTLTIAQLFAESHYDVMIFSNYGASSFLDRTLFSKIASRKVDAVVSFLEPDDDLVPVVRESKTPFLLVGRDRNDKQIDSIFSDDVEGGRIAVEHLIGRGHTKIAYIGAHPDISADAQRLRGYRLALDAHGIPFDPQFVGYFSEHKTFGALADRLLTLPVDAVFCFNDSFSYSIMDELRKRGKRIPEDYAWVGYDNIQHMLSLPSRLTTIAADNDYMARLAVEIVLKKIEHDESYKELLSHPIEVRLVCGETS